MKAVISAKTIAAEILGVLAEILGVPVMDQDRRFTDQGHHMDQDHRFTGQDRRFMDQGHHMDPDQDLINAYLFSFFYA
jgi:hypothetical protein